MPAKQPFFQGLTKTELRSKIRIELGSYRFDEEFECELVSDLIADKHYYCSVTGIRPLRFRKRFKPGIPYDFEGYFDGHGWHRVSWTQCLDPRDRLDWLKRALRDAAHPIVLEYKQRQPHCELCGTAPPEDVDHVDPEFDVIANRAIAALPEESIHELFEAFDFWTEERFSIPETNQAMVILRAAHSSAILRAVCKSCHKESAAKRRRG